MSFQPQFVITSYTLGFLTQAAELGTWIRQSAIDVSWLPRLQRDTHERLVHSSTAIEGNPLSLSEVQSLSRGDSILVAQKAQREVYNSLKALRWLWLQKSNSDISEKNLLKLHRLTMEKILENHQIGRYKTRPNRVIDHKGHTIYTPPSPEKTPVLTRQLLTWINNDKKLDPVIVSAVAHHQLVSIHPFADGNGRVARALALWLLYTRGFDTHHLFALDEFYETNRKLYYLKIQQARDLDDDLTLWLEYCAEGIVVTLKKTRERIENLQVMGKAPQMTLTQRQEDVLRFLRGCGQVKSPEIEKAFKLTRARINQILKPLVEAGLVTRLGQTRATKYRLT